MLVQKKCRFEKNFSLKKDCGPKKTIGPKNFCPKMKIVARKKNVGQ